MVRLSLSLKNRVPSSSARMTGAPQLAPPSVERLTSTALRAPTASAAPVKAMPICRAVVPLTATQGSDARANTPPAHCVNGEAAGVLQVVPPSTETAVARPRAPPSDKRSCCHAATRWFGLEGLIARCDSTSAFAYAVAPAGTARQLALKGVAAVTRTAVAVVNTGGSCGGGGGGGGGGSPPPEPPLPPPPPPQLTITSAMSRIDDASQVPEGVRMRSGIPFARMS